MRIAVVLVIALFVTSAPALAEENASLTRAQTQTFTVERVYDGGMAQIGSGVVVGRDGQTLVIATAGELARGSGRLRILDASRAAYYDVLGMRVLPDYDLALVRVRAQSGFPVSPAAFAPATAGEHVWIWGNDAAGSLASGTVRETRAHVPDAFGSARLTIVCNACADGDAGAGVFDERGRLLGIITKKWAHAPDALALFIEVEPSALIAQEALVPMDESSLAVDSRP